MKISLNNNPEILDDSRSWTVQDLMDLKNFSFKLLVVKVNGKLVPKTDYSIVTVHEGDDVMILHLMSGG
jgi:thiamine biosynthesis protein ThiS